MVYAEILAVVPTERACYRESLAVCWQRPLSQYYSRKFHSDCKSTVSLYKPLAPILQLPRYGEPKICAPCHHIAVDQPTDYPDVQQVKSIFPIT